MTTVVLVLATTACTNGLRTPAAPGNGIEVVGTLVALKDDRLFDGGIELTLEIASGTQDLVRVPSAFIRGPREAVLAMHAVVDAAKIGDRLRARGKRDDTGALQAEALEALPR